MCGSPYLADEQDPSSGSQETPPEVDFAAFEAATLSTLAPNFEPNKAATAAAKPVEQAASTDATPKPASEPGKKEKGAKARSAELDPEIAELQEKLRLRKMLREELAARDDKPADSSPAPVKAAAKEFERLKAMPDAPKLDEFNDYQDWSVAMAAFVTDKRLEEYSQKQKQEVEHGQFQSAASRMEAKGAETYEDFREAGTAAAQAGRAWPRPVTEFVLTHEHGHDVAYALAKAKDDDALYLRIADPIQFGMYVGEVLAQLNAPPKKSPKTPVSKAPEPPVMLGGRPHDTVDPSKAAMAAGDFSAFEADLMAKLRVGA